MLIPALPRARVPLVALAAIGLTLLALQGAFALSTGATSKVTAKRMAAWTVHITSDHADARHGSEASSARNCLNRNGIWQVWREPNGSYHRLCQTSGGEIFDQVVSWSEQTKRWEEVTAFKPNPFGKGKQWNAIRQWLEKKGATPYKGSLPPPAG